MERIPFHVPTLDESDIEPVVEVLRSKWITTGPRCREFEAAFAQFLGSDVQCLAVNSATAALHLGLEAVGVSEGDLVLVPTFTFTTCAEVVRYLGADPVFVDVDPQTFNLTPDSVQAAYQALRPRERKRVRALLPVHYGGLPCAMPELVRFGEEHGLAVVDDAAHALPARRQGRWIGTFGDVTAFSFYATKTLCTGEGGMVVTRDGELADRMRTMRLHGISRDAFDRYTSATASWYYEVVAPGFKYNMSDIMAALGLSQLPRIEAFRRAREAVAARYQKAFATVEGLGIPADAPAADLHAWHLYPLRVLDGREVRNRFIEELRAEGIGTSVHFIPLHLQPYYRDRYELEPDDLPVATRLFDQEVSLPIYPALRAEQVDRIVDTVPRALERARANTSTPGVR